MSELNCKNAAIRFRHHFLYSGGVLTVATRLNYETREVHIGWAVFNPSDKKWVRKIGSTIAKNRLENSNLYYTLSEHEPILCDYLSLRALQLISGLYTVKNGDFAVNSNANRIPISKTTLDDIIQEMHRITGIFGGRLV